MLVVAGTVTLVHGWGALSSSGTAASWDQAFSGLGDVLKALVFFIAATPMGVLAVLFEQYHAHLQRALARPPMPPPYARPPGG